MEAARLIGGPYDGANGFLPSLPDVIRVRSNPAGGAYGLVVSLRAEDGVKYRHSGGGAYLHSDSHSPSAALDRLTEAVTG